VKAGIIGAGITGLVSAYELSKKGINVTLMESGNTAGGIGGTFEYGGYSIEKYYHHFFKSDAYIMKILKELSMENDIDWYASKMGFFSGNALYDFGTPVSLMKFKPLSLLDKIRFGTAVLKLLTINDYEKFEHITAAEWIAKNAGIEVFNKVWKPLLITKFGDKYDKVSMSWFWGKIKLRGTSKENGREVLGYIKGSNKRLIDRLEDEINKSGGKIFFNCSVDSIKGKEQFTLGTTCGELKFDRIISTVPLPVTLNIGRPVLPGEYKHGKECIGYTAVVCMVLILDRAFTEYYWLNIGDYDIPFGGLIEHTNLIDSSKYGGDHILYISNYVYKSSPYFTMDNEELLCNYEPYLKKVNPEFNRSWIKDFFVFRDEYAQPVIEPHYSKVRPDFITPVPGFYTASMANIYPEDRGMNYAVRDGIRVSMEVLRGEPGDK
jgi:Protoporphyrinogen oxidase